MLLRQEAGRRKMNAGPNDDSKCQLKLDTAAAFSFSSAFTQASPVVAVVVVEHVVHNTELIVAAVVEAIPAAVSPDDHTHTRFGRVSTQGKTAVRPVLKCQLTLVNIHPPNKHTLSRSSRYSCSWLYAQFLSCRFRH